MSAHRPSPSQRLAAGAATAAALWAAQLLFGCEGGSDEPASAGGAAAGERLFSAYCSACHRMDGAGTTGGPPPLLGSAWVGGPESRLIRIVLSGLRGPLEVAGKTYNLEMPGFGQILSDADIASVLSFARARFAPGSRSIGPEEVRRVRAATSEHTDYWTARELLELR